jgi:hypothetical protein
METFCGLDPTYFVPDSNCSGCFHPYLLGQKEPGQKLKLLPSRAGAAKNSFVKKCERDSGAPVVSAAQVCESKAAEKKLAGAAKNSFVKKCEKDAVAG